MSSIDNKKKQTHTAEIETRKWAEIFAKMKSLAAICIIFAIFHTVITKYITSAWYFTEKCHLLGKTNRFFFVIAQFCRVLNESFDLIAGWKLIRQPGNYDGWHMFVMFFFCCFHLYRSKLLFNQVILFDRFFFAVVLVVSIMCPYYACCSNDLSVPIRIEIESDRVRNCEESDRGEKNIEVDDASNTL